MAAAVGGADYTSWFNVFYLVLVTGSVLAAAYSLFVRSASFTQRKFILVFWLIAPPTFFPEYYFREAGLRAEEVVSAALAAIYFKE